MVTLPRPPRHSRVGVSTRRSPGRHPRPLPAPHPAQAGERSAASALGLLQRRDGCGDVAAGELGQPDPTQMGDQVPLDVLGVERSVLAGMARRVKSKNRGHRATVQVCAMVAGRAARGAKGAVAPRARGGVSPLSLFGRNVCGSGGGSPVLGSGAPFGLGLDRGDEVGDGGLPAARHPAHSSVVGAATGRRQQVSWWERGKRIPTPYWRGWLSQVLAISSGELDRAAAVAKLLRAVPEARSRRSVRSRQTRPRDGEGGRDAAP